MLALAVLAVLAGLNGWHAVRNHTSNMMYVPLTDDSLMSRLRSDPRAVPAAVEELLRWIPHKDGVGQPRVATEDVEVGGVRIRRGEAVYVSYVAANWDEACYPEPGRIDIDRQGRPHLAFGCGAHHCVAPLLARLEAELLLTTLVERLPDLRLAVDPGEVIWQKNVLIRGPVGLPVMVGPYRLHWMTTRRPFGAVAMTSAPRSPAPPPLGLPGNRRARRGRRWRARSRAGSSRDSEPPRWTATCEPAEARLLAGLGVCRMRYRRRRGVGQGRGRRYRSRRPK